MNREQVGLTTEGVSLTTEEGVINLIHIVRYDQGIFPRRSRNLCPSNDISTVFMYKILTALHIRFMEAVCCRSVNSFISVTIIVTESHRKAFQPTATAER